jgi:ABC-type branched-subunit amino acid transport system substrate-binding protein
MKPKVLVSIFIILFFSSQAFAGVVFVSKTARILLARIFEELEQKGPKEEIIDELGDFIEKHPYSDVTDKAISRLARIYKEKKGFEEAKRCYEELLQDFPPERYKSESLYGLAHCRYLGGRLEKARGLLASVKKTPEAPAEVKVKAGELLKEIEKVIPFLAVIRPEDAAIGALLPLDGDYAPFGNAALNGIHLAARVFGERHFLVEIKAMDPGTGPESVKRLKALIDNQNVVGLVGPLLSRTALPVGRFAELNKIPVIVISQKSGVPQLGDYVFRNFLTPRQQARTIADYAYNTLGLKRFAVLYPKNSYGTELSGSFKQEVEELGGVVVGEVSYRGGQTDFSAELEYLFGVEVTEYLEGRRHVTEYRRTIDADALFIPDYHHTVGLIAPFLIYYDIDDIMLLGSNGWNSPKLTELAGDYVEGAVFVDGFFSESGRPATAEFVRRFKEAYGYSPGIIEAQAYDAAMMLLLALKEGPVSREGIKERLKKITDPDGATAEITFDRVGEAKKELFLLTVEDGKIRELVRP